VPVVNCRQKVSSAGEGFFPGTHLT
jgi:hypothetical protein